MSTIEKQNGKSHPLGRRKGEKKRGSRKSQEVYRVITTLLLSPLILLVGNGAINSETFFLSAAARLGFQSSTMKICSDQGLGVCPYSPDVGME